MKYVYEGSPQDDPNRDASWMWRGTYFDPSIQFLNNVTKLRWDPNTRSYRAGYVQDGQWHWGSPPGFSAGGAGGTASAAAPSGVAGGATGGAAGTGAGAAGAGTSAGAGGIGGSGMGWGELIGAGANAYSSYANANAQKDAAKAQADLYNNWLKLYQDTGQGLYGQAQAAGWNPFGPKVSTNSNTSSFSNRGGSQYSNKPVITEEYQPLDELMRGIMTGRLASGSSLPQGYASSAARGINESFAGTDAAARNLAARRGLSGEQTYAVASPAASARAGQLADMRAKLPLLERQMQNEDIGITQGLQSAFGRGEAGQSQNWQTGTSQSSGTNTMPFTANDLSAIMGILMPPGPQQSGLTGTSTSGAVVDSLGALMGWLASQQNQNRGGGGGGGGGYNYGSAGAPPTPYGYG